ncbi:MFS transporter [Actinoplanes sp. TFC3]|uniref:CynX/NimT family MFS transporter n=1 Tax=Actinoplanes sp. TFC3 TaxID=1710355 RepID=UPI000B03788F|nr:MFS transporter [Actinoplanes sp. TFC3]
MVTDSLTERPAAGPATRALSPALVLAGLLLVAANLRAGITTVGPVLEELRRDLGLASFTASALISLPLVAFAVISPVAPAVSRRLGLERTLGLGLAGLALGLVVRSLPGQPLLWLGTALLGVAIAVVNVVLPALVKRDFPTRIGQITGRYSAVQSVFAATAAGVAVPMAGLTSAGWRLPLGMWAGLAVIALGVLAPQLRRHTVAAPVAAPSVASVKSPWRSAVGWQVTAYMALQSTGYYVFITWLPSIEESAGVSATAAGVHQLLLNGLGIAGSIACSALIPRLRDQRLIGVLAPLLFVVAVVGVLVAPTYSAIWTTFAGVGGGASIVLALSFFGLRTRNHTQAAALSGMAQSVGYLVAAAGPIAVGALHDATGTWKPALVTILALELVLAGVGYFAGRNKVIQ